MSAQLAKQAILDERTRRNYRVTVCNVRRTHSVAGILLPVEMETYVADTYCTEHKTPCYWLDTAFRAGGTWHAILFNDLWRGANEHSLFAALVASYAQFAAKEQARWLDDNSGTLFTRYYTLDEMDLDLASLVREAKGDH